MDAAETLAKLRVHYDSPQPVEGAKYDGEKPPLDLIPPKAALMIGEAYAVGARKYAHRNWEYGIRWGRVFGALLRHAWAWWGGERRCPEDGQHHLASVVWCALALMTYEDTHPEFDDRDPSWPGAR